MSEIEPGVEAVVSGRVVKVGEAKNGPYAVVEVDRTQYESMTVTVWRTPAAVEDIIRVRGRLSWRRYERGGMEYLNVSLNDAQIERVIPHEPLPTLEPWAPTLPEPDPWNPEEEPRP